MLATIKPLVKCEAVRALAVLVADDEVSCRLLLPVNLHELLFLSGMGHFRHGGRFSSQGDD